MSTLDLSLRDYLADVAAPAPSSTGGSVCAVTLASAAGLVEMSARLSGSMDDSSAIAERAGELRHRAVTLASADSMSYRAVCTVQRLDKDSPGRSQAIRDALVAAAQPPARMAHLGSEIASLAALVSAAGNPVTRGDAITAASLASASARSAATLARTNLTTAGLDGDAAHAAEEAAESAEQSAQLALNATAPA